MISRVRGRLLLTNSTDRGTTVRCGRTRTMNEPRVELAARLQHLEMGRGPRALPPNNSSNLRRFSRRATAHALL